MFGEFPGVWWILDPGNLVDFLDPDEFPPLRLPDILSYKYGDAHIFMDGLVGLALSSSDSGSN